MSMILSGISVSAANDAATEEGQSMESSQTDQNQQQMNDEADQEINQEIDGTQEQSELTENPDTPENTAGERTVVSVDGNGNVFDVEEETDGVVKEDLSNKARAAATYIVNFRANAAGASVGNNTTEYKEYSTNAAGYCYGGAGADAAYLGTENGKVKFMQSGVVGLVDQSKVQVVNLNSAKSYSNYYADGSSIIHRICMDMTTPGYGGSVNVGPQQSYMKTGTTYYSYDGHYFYTNYVTMLSDYKSNTRKNSINPNNPYYNYYQYLPLRGKSSYSANELSTIINKHAQSSSKMYNKGAAFVNNQNSYGVNALLMTGVGALESAWGTSSIAKQKNNLFGLNAVDTSPGQSANTFSSVDVCIKDFAETYMSKQYLRAGWAYYHGGFLGDKASGINVSYASDPYWGEKIAALAWKMDSEGGKKDQNKYSIGIKDTVSTAHTTLNVRKEASTSATSLYNTGTSSNYAFLILGESGDFYKVQSDPVLKADRGGIESTSGKYNSSSMYAYASKQYIKKINTGTSGLNGGNTIPDTKKTGVIYSTHIQSDGWQASKANGEISGTTGEAKRIEAIKIQLSNIGYTGSVQYSTHVQSNGWKNWVSDGTIGGTTGEAKRMEAIRIRLTGEAANHYDIYYRVHTQTYGWLDWAKNGEKAGSSTYGKRLEAIEIKLVKKGESAPGSTKKAYQVPRIQYQTHVQSIGWQKKVSDNQIAGTTGQGKRIEAIKITLPDSDYTGNVEYQAYVQGIGWQSWKKNGELAGTSGQSKRIEAIRVKLTGEIAKYYEVYYSIHLAKIGWCNYESAGRVTGTIDLSKKIEALKICLVKKDAETAPNTSGVKYVEGYKSGNFYYNGYIKGVGATGNVSQGNTVGTIGKKQQLQSLTLYLDQSNKLAPSGTIQYATHIAKEGWKDWSDAGTTNGASTGTNGMEAVKIRLTGNLAKYYDIYYRAHVQGYGWLGWAKNGQAAGTSKIGYRMEGLQIRLVSKDAAAPGKNANYYTEKKKTATIAVKDQMHLRALAYASNTRYLILVDTTANRVGIYSGSVGKWNEVKKWVCTTGAKSTPTVKGTFTVQGKGKSFGSGYTCWYYTQFYGNYLFHSVLYKQGSMSVITDGRLGINASHGCVRLNINNAKWIYDNIPRGTKVVVY